MNTSTPLMKQYWNVKKKYPDAIILFRVGDFYETFGEDAIKTSKILNIVLTKKVNRPNDTIELAGFPYHSLETHLPKLVQAGNRIAVCNQLENPQKAKGLVKRGVTELITPGLSLHDEILDQKKNNYLASLAKKKDVWGIAFLELSTGEFVTTQGSETYIKKLIEKFQPAEIILDKTVKKNHPEFFTEDYPLFLLDSWLYSFDYTYEKLLKHFGTKSLQGFGIEKLPVSIMAAGIVIHYLQETKHNANHHITSVKRIEGEKSIWLDKFTIQNLELLAPKQEDGGSLLQVIDQTNTPMGCRLLKKWILFPLKDADTIQKRLNIVDSLYHEQKVLHVMLTNLKKISDLERLITKISTDKINPRELWTLTNSLTCIIPIKETLSKAKSKELNTLADQLQDCQKVIKEIENNIQVDPPLSIQQGRVIKSKVNQELDELHYLLSHNKEQLKQIQEKSIQKTGISSLKISYNKVFGYYLEVTHAHRKKVPSNWIRKQTLVNAERYVTEELKIYEDKIIKAQDKIQNIEQEIYTLLLNNLKNHILVIQQNARIISMLDLYTNFAKIAQEYNYTKPIVNETHTLDIKGGRHPVIEQKLNLGEKYIQNNVLLNQHEQQILIITGPNMAGKSALLRQTALIVLLAQIGSFVPAEKAEIGIIDKIFTRVGASDNLTKGESTFMVEMTETANILNNLSERSLLLMDEIGRGTSTYDGISIAWAIIDYLHNNSSIKPKTLFATHYHELDELASSFKRVKNFFVEVKKIGGDILFLRQLKKGSSQHSFGIDVAKMAGVPIKVIQKATSILEILSNKKVNTTSNKEIIGKIHQKIQKREETLVMKKPQMQKIQEILTKLDVNTLTPMEAMFKLNEMKHILDLEISSELTQHKSERI